MFKACGFVLLGEKNYDNDDNNNNNNNNKTTISKAVKHG